jgi:DNA-directed RNA polymerase subunit E'/Rpb7
MTDKREQKIYGVYNQGVLTKKIYLTIREICNNIKKILEERVADIYEGKCIDDGFIKPGSVSLLTYSSGVISGEDVEFQVIFDCMICNPTEGMLVECKTKTITKAGIHAIHTDKDGVSPLTVFIARDHHNTNAYFNSINEDTNITVKIIGVRFELDDEYICAIASLPSKTIQRDENKKIKIKIRK